VWLAGPVPPEQAQEFPYYRYIICTSHHDEVSRPYIKGGRVFSFASGLAMTLLLFPVVEMENHLFITE
jgi:hypothetical protein